MVAGTCYISYTDIAMIQPALLMWLTELKAPANIQAFLIIQRIVLCYVRMNTISLTMNERGTNVCNTNTVIVLNSKKKILFFQDLQLHSVSETIPLNWPISDSDTQPLADQQQFQPDTIILTANATRIQTQLPVCLSCCKCKLWWL